MTKRITTLLASIGLFAAVGAQAQDVPITEHSLCLPFTAGSATDTLARLLANRMSTTLGRNVFVENIAGGSGIPAAQNVVRSAPDGYTVMVTANTTHAGNQACSRKCPTTPWPTSSPSPNSARSRLRWCKSLCAANDVKGLIAYARTNPGKLTFGAGSTSSRMSAELLKTMAGIDMLYVPYKSNPQAVTDLLGGQISDLLRRRCVDGAARQRRAQAQGFCGFWWTTANSARCISKRRANQRRRSCSTRQCCTSTRSGIAHHKKYLRMC